MKTPAKPADLAKAEAGEALSVSRRALRTARAGLMHLAAAENGLVAMMEAEAETSADFHLAAVEAAIVAGRLGMKTARRQARDVAAAVERMKEASNQPDARRARDRARALATIADALAALRRIAAPPPDLFAGLEPADERQTLRREADRLEALAEAMPRQGLTEGAHFAAGAPPIARELRALAAARTTPGAPAAFRARLRAAAGRLQELADSTRGAAALQEALAAPAEATP